MLSGVGGPRGQDQRQGALPPSTGRWSRASQSAAGAPCRRRRASCPRAESLRAHRDPPWRESGFTLRCGERGLLRARPPGEDPVILDLAPSAPASARLALRVGQRCPECACPPRHAPRWRGDAVHPRPPGECLLVARRHMAAPSSGSHLELPECRSRAGLFWDFIRMGSSPTSRRRQHRATVTARTTFAAQAVRAPERAASHERGVRT